MAGALSACLDLDDAHRRLRSGLRSDDQVGDSCEHDSPTAQRNGESFMGPRVPRRGERGQVSVIRAACELTMPVNTRLSSSVIPETSATAPPGSPAAVSPARASLIGASMRPVVIHCRKRHRTKRRNAWSSLVAPGGSSELGMVSGATSRPRTSAFTRSARPRTPRRGRPAERESSSHSRRPPPSSGSAFGLGMPAPLSLSRIENAVAVLTASALPRGVSGGR